MTGSFPNGLVFAGFVSVLSHICVYVGGGVSKGESGSHRTSLQDTVKGFCEDFGEGKKIISTLKYYPILFVLSLSHLNMNS